MSYIKLNLYSYIHFSFDQEKGKSYLKRTIKSVLPFFVFYQPTADLLSSGIALLKGRSHFASARENRRQNKKVAQVVETLQGLALLPVAFAERRVSLVVSSGYHIFQDGKSVYSKIKNKNYLRATTASLNLIRNAINLTSVAIPSPQMIALCLGAQVIAQLYATAKTAKKKGFCIETISHFAVSAIYSYQFTKQIELIIELSKTRLLEPFFLAIEKIRPGQSRYSSKNTDDKVGKILKDKGALYDQEKGWQCQHDGNKSAYPLDKAVPVVLGPDGLILLIDGHHDVLASLSVGATTMPVKVVANWENVPSEQFWNKAADFGYVYPYTLQGEKKLPPRSFAELVDDPNRYFAAIAARKLLEGGSMEQSIGADFPLWIKIGKDIPFIEFKISDLLMKSGLIFNYEMEKNHQAYNEFLENARKILVANPIEGLRTISERTYYKDIKFAA